MLRVRFPPSHPETVLRKSKMLFEAPKKWKQSENFGVAQNERVGWKRQNKK
jgi:hypothetical protein